MKKNIMDKRGTLESDVRTEKRAEVEPEPRQPKTWIGRKIARTTEILKKYSKIKEKEKEIKKKHVDRIRQERKKMLKKYLERAGLPVKSEKITKILFNLCIFANLIISSYLIYFFSVRTEASVWYVLLVMAVVWILIFFVVVFIVWLLFYLVLDFKIFQRKMTIEEVLADFLQLTSANIRAGMPIDKALWFSVRPRFGVLANEIEIVAKETISGKDLEEALVDFTKKYKSPLLSRSINLLIEGLRAGGEVGDLLNRISANISESRLMRKEMSANVTTYVIFITFATVIAAPILFALSSQLLNIIGGIITTIDRPAGGAVGGFSTAFTTMAITPEDFKIFAIVMLSITAFFSASIIAIIRKGAIKGGLKYIPSFIIISIILFYIDNSILSVMLGGILA